MVRLKKRVVLFAMVAFMVSAVSTGFCLDTKGATVNINTASKEQLTTLKMIGPAKAAAIIQYRKVNGPFKSADELTKVKGIGKKLFKMNKDRITVGGAKPSKAKKKAADKAEKKKNTSSTKTQKSK